MFPVNWSWAEPIFFATNLLNFSSMVVAARSVTKWQSWKSFWFFLQKWTALKERMLDWMKYGAESFFGKQEAGSWRRRDFVHKQIRLSNNSSFRRTACQSKPPPLLVVHFLAAAGRELGTRRNRTINQFGLQDVQFYGTVDEWDENFRSGLCFLPIPPISLRPVFPSYTEHRKLNYSVRLFSFVLCKMKLLVVWVRGKELKGVGGGAGTRIHERVTWRLLLAFSFSYSSSSRHPLDIVKNEEMAWRTAQRR